MRQRMILSYSLIFLIFCAKPTFGSDEGIAPASDVRVIIDVSGSMKKTDPANLRRPALDLIVRLLPDGSKAGIWTFGHNVNNLMPHGIVDQAWRVAAVQKATLINSSALFTDIGAALDSAAHDYEVSTPDYQRNIILLTDGVVDISKEAISNLNARKRIFLELIPRLKSSGYRVHTIALSADADVELLKKLALGTDGVFAIAETAEQLMSTFLRIFDQAVPAERVPLNENGFLVDPSIQEFSALIFRGVGAPSTVIVGPDGQEFNNTDPKNNVNWYRTDQYDLITVQQPKSGQWTVKTSMAPNSRVTVVSDLQLIVQPPKNNIKIKQPLALTYSFQESKQTVIAPEFLNLLTAEALVAKLNGQQGFQQTLTSAQIPSDGIFHTTLRGFEEAGSYDVNLKIDGKTFKREFLHHLSVTESIFTIDKRVDEVQGKRTHFYKVTALAGMADSKETTVAAIIKNWQTAHVERVPVRANQDHWVLEFVPLSAARYTVTMDIETKDADGSLITETLLAEDFYHPDEADTSNPSSQVESTPQDSPQQAPSSVAPSTEQPNKSLIYLAIGLGNLLVLAAGYFVYRLIAGKTVKPELEDIDGALPLKSANVKPVEPQMSVAEMAPDDDPPTISMDGGPSIEDLMADNLFPLDSLDEPPQKS